MNTITNINGIGMKGYIHLMTKNGKNIMRNDFCLYLNFLNNKKKDYLMSNCYMMLVQLIYN